LLEGGEEFHAGVVVDDVGLLESLVGGVDEAVEGLLEVVAAFVGGVEGGL
jgi:hypothetical protein